MPGRSLQLSVLGAPTSSERQVTTQYGLRFDGIQSCKFDFEAQLLAA